MRKHKYEALQMLARKMVDWEYPIADAVHALLEMAEPNPDAIRGGTYMMDVHLRLRKGVFVRGSVDLPHGTGREIDVLALSRDEALLAQAVQGGGNTTFAGDLRANEHTLVMRGKDGATRTMSLEARPTKMGKLFRRVIMTTDMKVFMINPLPGSEHWDLEQICSKHSMLPSKKDGTLVTAKDFVERCEKHATGKVDTFCSHHIGKMIPLLLGKVDVHTPEQIVENAVAALEAIREAKPKTKRSMRRFELTRGKYINKAVITINGLLKVKVDVDRIVGGRNFYGKTGPGSTKNTPLCLRRSDDNESTDLSQPEMT